VEVFKQNLSRKFRPPLALRCCRAGVNLDFATFSVQVSVRNPNFLFSEPNRDVVVRVAGPGLGNRRRVVLAVAENAETFSLIRSASTDLGSGLDVQRVKSGQHALQFLQKKSPYERAEMPGLVAIDTASFAGKCMARARRAAERGWIALPARCSCCQ
jgi:hypothetical protein